MEKEKILSTINERLEAEGIKTTPFQRSFTTYIESNLPAEGTEPDDQYFNTHVGILKSFSGQFNHDVASQVEEFKKNYKPEPPKSDPPKNGGADDPDKALTDRIKALEEKLSESDRKNRSASIREKVTSAGTTLKVSNKALWRDSVALAEISDTDTAETVTAKVKLTYERKLKEYFGDGAVPFGGASGGSVKNTPTSEEVKARRAAFKARMKAQGRL